jgi:hypothetical protein
VAVRSEPDDEVSTLPQFNVAPIQKLLRRLDRKSRFVNRRLQPRLFFLGTGGPPCAALDIRPILCRQERVGGGLADGYTRIKRGKRNGVFAAQAGPGIENAFPGIAQANGSGNAEEAMLGLSILNSERALRDPGLWRTAVDANMCSVCTAACVHAHASLMRAAN